MRNLPDLLTPTEVSEILKVAVSTLAVWRHRQQGPPYIAVEGRVRYSRAALCDWLDRNTTRVAG